MTSRATCLFGSGLALLLALPVIVIVALRNAAHDWPMADDDDPTWSTTQTDWPGRNE